MRPLPYIALLIWVLGLAALQPIQAQHTPHANTDSVKVHNLKEWFSGGQFHGHMRYYFMATTNYRQLPNYWANAAGGALHFKTAWFKGFQFNVAGQFAANLYSANLGQVDSLSGGRSRFERQLFDVTDPDNKHNLDRLEELNLAYRRPGLFIRLGKQTLETPLMNLTDSRMKPFKFKGLLVEVSPTPQVHLHASWWTMASPRSTVEWWGIGHSIGVYNQGVQPNGTKAHYHEQLQSSGVGILGWQQSLSLPKSLQGSFEVWNYYAQNLMNTVFGQTQWQGPLYGATATWLAGAQALYQWQLGNGGHSVYEHRYFHNGQTGSYWSLRSGLKARRFKWLLNYGQTGSGGRFVFPREWGVPQFFTHLSRLRMEGNGGSHVLTSTIEWQPRAVTNATVKLGVACVRYAEAHQTALSKYGDPSHEQLLADVHYHFHHYLEGLHVRFLYVYKHLANYLEPEPLNRILNKANMHHFNLIANIHF